MRRARYQGQPAGPTYAVVEPLRNRAAAARAIGPGGLGNQAMLRRFSQSAPVIRRETPTPDTSKKPAPASPTPGPVTSPAPDAAKVDDVKLTIPWDEVLKGKTKLSALLLPQLQRPDAGGATPATPQGPVAGGGASPAPSLPAATPAGGGPAAPSRLSLKDFGSLSIGLQMGFPALKSDGPAGAAPSALQQSLQTGEIINYSFSGKVPSAYKLDMSSFIGTCWSLFSTYVAPDMAAKIARGMAGKTAGGGVSYELNGVLLPDFSGAGLSFTLRLGGGKAPTVPAEPAAPVQRKLAVGSTSDPLEAEADRAAEQVMRMAAPSPHTAGTGGVVQRKCAVREEDTATLNKKGATSAEGGEAPAIVHDTLAEPGRPLDGATRSFFEPRFGVDLSDVRVHQGQQAQKSADAVGALAYAVGDNIVFNAGRYQPDTTQGKALLAHELAHTIQQKGESVRRIEDPAKDQVEPTQTPGAGAKLAARPTSNAFWGAYLQVNYMTFQKDDVWSYIGGSVALAFHKQNSCATRMSYALNNSGLPIPTADNTEKFFNNPAVKYQYKAGDGKNYIVGAPAMDKFLKAQIGPPDQKLATPDQLKAFQASLGAEQVAIFAAVGHTGMLRGSGYQDPYIDIELPVDVWKLP